MALENDISEFVAKYLRSKLPKLTIGTEKGLFSAPYVDGAKRALIPIENKRNFLDVSADIMEHVDPIFFGDPKTAAMKVLGG